MHLYSNNLISKKCNDFTIILNVHFLYIPNKESGAIFFKR